jgi:hypothetical protein
MTSSDFGFDFSRAPGNSGDERKLLSLLRESEMAGKRRLVRAIIFVAALSRNGWVSLWLAGDRGIGSLCLRQLFCYLALASW